MSNGLFISFEGPEGGGKSTMLKRTAEWLIGQGKEVLCTREPGGTKLGDYIRDMLKHDSCGESPTNATEVLLFLASRAQHVDTVIEPALLTGKIVLCDRFEDSTFAYQSYARGYDLGVLQNLNSFATSGFSPSIVLIFDIGLEDSLKRMKKRQAITETTADRIEMAGNDFHQKVRNGFLSLQKEDPEHKFLIDASLEEELVWEQVKKVLTDKIQHRSH